MRIFTAALATETNTFSPIAIDLRAFEASLYAPPGQHPETPTLCTAPITVGRRICAAEGWELIEGTAAWADPAGLINRETYETLRDEILDQLRVALPVDAVVLGLHGAMVAAGYDDPEGDFLTRVREIVGPAVPICAELDPHSHLTQKRVGAADWFVAFKEFPHTDFVARAEDLWSIAVKRLKGEVAPVMSVFDCRMIDVFPTSQQPMRGFVDKMMEIEKTDPKVLSISLIHGFMAGDVPELGTKMIVVTDGDRAYGEALAETLGREVFAMRGKVMMGAGKRRQRARSCRGCRKPPGRHRRHVGQSRRRHCRRLHSSAGGHSRARHDGCRHWHDLGSRRGPNLRLGRRRCGHSAALWRQVCAGHRTSGRSVGAGSAHRHGRPHSFSVTARCLSAIAP